MIPYTTSEILPPTKGLRGYANHTCNFFRIGDKGGVWQDTRRSHLSEEPQIGGWFGFQKTLWHLAIRVIRKVPGIPPNADFLDKS
jgi:hypothetical protein